MIKDHPSIDNLIKVSSLNQDSLNLGFASFYKMRTELHLNNLDSILYYTNVSYSVGRKYNDTYLIARTNQALGRYYLLTSDYPRSLELFLSSNEYFENTNDSLQLIFSYNDLGGFYIITNEIEKAESYLDKSFTIAAKLNNSKGKTFYFANKSNIDINNKNYENALANIKLALQHFEELKDTVNQIKGHTTIGNLHFNLKDLSNAKESYDKAIYLINKSKGDILLGRVLIGYGQIEETKSNYKTAIDFYKQAYEVNQKQQLHREEISALQKLYDVYHKQHNYKQALLFLSEILDKKELLNGIKINQQLEKIHWVSILDKNQHKYDLEQQKQKTTIMLQICLILLIGGLTLFYATLYFTKKKRFKLNQVLNAQLIEKIETEENLKKLELEHHKLQLENKDRELTSLNIQILSKNKLLNDVEYIITNNEKNLVLELRKIINTNRDLEKDWKQFTTVFEKIHPNFFNYIHQNHPELSKVDIKICAYIKINFSNYEIASLLNVNYQSVIKGRYRIRKKLSLQNEDDLDKIIAHW